MPELPEVETTRRRLAPRVEGRRIDAVSLRRGDLRWPIDREIGEMLPGARIVRVGRRAKYLILETDRGAAISHFGMSGRWSIVPDTEEPQLHDHVDVHLDGGEVLRYHDPRRFGALLWGGDDPARHPRLSGLGPEPWGEDGPESIGDHLWRTARGRSAPLRNFLLDGGVVAGVGNIYASEAAHQAMIRPTRAASRISRARYRTLAVALAEVLEASILRGGTTLRDYSDPAGNAGRYGEICAVYGRAGEACPRCGGTVRRVVISARSLYYCPKCQK